MVPLGPTKLIVMVHVAPGFLVVPEQVSPPILNAVPMIFVTVAVPKVTGAPPLTVSVTVSVVRPVRLPNARVVLPFVKLATPDSLVNATVPTARSSAPAS